MTVKSSFLTGLISAVFGAYNNSMLKKLLNKVSRLFKESCFYGILKGYIYKKPAVFGCMIVGIFNLILAKISKISDSLTSFSEGSLTVRLVKKAVEHKDIFLYILIAYPFTDMIVRNYLGAFAGSWDELLFCGLTLLLFCDFWFNHKNRGYAVTMLNLPIIIFLAVMGICWFVISPDRKIGLEGLRAVCEYIFWFFIVLKLCDSDKLAKRLCVCLFTVIGIMALHGIYQYIVAAPMPASWVDHNEAGVRTRVYSILTSPNVLGCLMTMTAPIGVGLFLEENVVWKKALYAAGVLCIIAALGFTFSRGAWLGFLAAVVVFVLFYNYRLLIPVLCLGALVCFLAPEVGNRISYMLSPEYIESSMNGGRLIRWIDGLKVWSHGKVFGVGLGHFGGAVAENHKMTYLIADEYIETVYIDNYYLKTMIETGVAGLCAFVFLMYQVFINSVRAVKCSAQNKFLKIGIMSGLFGVIVHNLVENIFEVPLVSTEFWVFAGVLMGFWYRIAVKAYKEEK